MDGMKKYLKQNLKKFYNFLHQKSGFLYLPPRDVCIVTGCPRSGTSAMFHWLAKYNQTVGFNEQRICNAISDFIEKIYLCKSLYANKDILEYLLKKLLYSYLNNQKIIWNKIIVIKEPVPLYSNSNFITNVRKLLPKVKIIFMVRHPVSILNSMKGRKWGFSVRGVEPHNMPLDEGIKRWKSSVSTYIKSKNENLYLCMFENLIKDPNTESAKIKNFLKIKQLDTFEVKAVAEINLEDNIVQKILGETEKEREFFKYK
jgi:hypothetical protein